MKNWIVALVVTIVMLSAMAVLGGVLTFFLRILTLAIGEDWAFLSFLAVPSVILFVIVLKYIRGEADR